MTASIDFETIDRQIEELQREMEGCQQAMTLSRAVIYVAALTFLLVLTVATPFRTPIVVFSTIAAMMGGTVWLGANKSTLQEAAAHLAALDAVKNKMIDRVASANGWCDLTPTID